MAPRDLNTAELVQRVRSALSMRGVDAEEKKMFGSIAFMVRGKMCIAARAERLMARFDPALQDKLAKHPGCTPVLMQGREMRGYLHVSAEVVRTQKALCVWIDLALAFNEALTQKAER